MTAEIKTLKVGDFLYQYHEQGRSESHTVWYIQHEVVKLTKTRATTEDGRSWVPANYDQTRFEEFGRASSRYQTIVSTSAPDGATVYTPAAYAEMRRAIAEKNAMTAAQARAALLEVGIAHAISETVKTSSGAYGGMYELGRLREDVIAMESPDRVEEYVRSLESALCEKQRALAHLAERIQSSAARLVEDAEYAVKQA